MRLTPHQVDLLSFEIARELVKTEAVEANLDRLADLIRRELTEDLKVEDDLELEVHTLLKSMSAQLTASGADYKAMFDKVKKQLIRERRLVL